MFFSVLVVNGSVAYTINHVSVSVSPPTPSLFCRFVIIVRTGIFMFFYASCNFIHISFDMCRIALTPFLPSVIVFIPPSVPSETMDRNMINQSIVFMPCKRDSCTPPPPPPPLPPHHPLSRQQAYLVTQTRTRF